MRENQTVYISDLFERDKNNNYTKSALLYQDIFRYYFVINKTLSENIPFRLRELQNWIVRNNLEIIEYYQGSKSHTSISNRIHAREERINGMFEKLIQMHLINKSGTGIGRKVEVEVPLYCYTETGRLIVLIIKSMNLENEILFERNQQKMQNKKNELKQNNQIIYGLIDSLLTIEDYSPYSHIFYSALFKKFKDKEVFDKFIQHMIGQCNSNLSIKNIPHLFTYAVSMEFKDKEVSKNFLDLYRATIKELDPEVQNIVYYQLKLSTERRFEDKMNYLSKDYEKHRFMFRADHKSIVLEGYCEKCKQRTTKVISYFDYRNKTTLIDRNDPIRLDCKICKTRDSYVIPNF
jgi:hypothetical protein